MGFLPTPLFALGWGAISWSYLVWGLSGGIASFFSPCALPMLPAYLSYYVASDQPDGRSATSASSSLRRGTRFGAVSGFGMLAVFVAVAVLTGLVGELLQSVISDFIPVVGIVVIGIGVAMLTDRAGWLSRTVPLPEWREPSLRHFLAFGVLFALAALGCTAPIFIGVTLTALSTGGLGSMLSFFAGYASGMVGLFVVMTALVALAKEETARQLRSLIPYVEKASALLLIAAGGYMLYYYWTILSLST